MDEPRMENLRMGITFAKAVKMGIGGGVYPLDAYRHLQLFCRWRLPVSEILFQKPIPE